MLLKKKISSWKKKEGLKTKFPNDEILPIENLNPDNYDRIFHLNLSKKYANRYIYYYAADSKDDKNCLDIKYVKDAYGNYSNKGVVKTDIKGIAKLNLKCPQSYYVDKDNYFISHIHYLISDKDNKKWLKTLYTERIICNIQKEELKELIKKGCAVIINSLPFHEFIKDRINNSISLPYDIVKSGKISEKQIKSYLSNMIINYPKIYNLLKNKKIKLENIPMIVYCYDKNCNASDILIENLVKIGFTNIKEYPDGIKGWLSIK